MAMPISSPDIHTTPITPIISPTLHKSVLLHDWWLIKAENGKRLAVGGLTSTGKMETAPIVKRCNMLNLETSDGMTVFLNGNINKTCSHKNGISFEVCNHFLSGFPDNWEMFCYPYEEGSPSTYTTSRSNVCDNLKDGEFKGNLSEKKLEDTALHSVSQMNAGDSSLSDIELHKTENISNQNEVGAQVVSKTSKTNHSYFSTKVSVNCSEPLEDLHVPRGSDVNSVTPFKLEMDNSEEISSQCWSPSEKVKYAINRIKTIFGSKQKDTNFCDSVGPDMVSVDYGMHCESGGKNIFCSPCIGLDETMCESSLKVNSVCPNYSSTKCSLSTFAPTNSAQVLNSPVVTYDAETSDQNACRSYDRLDGVNHTDCIELSLRQKTRHDSKLGISQTKTKNSLSTFVPPDSVQVQNSSGVTNGAETSDPNTLKFYNRLVDANHTDYMELSVKQKDSHDSKLRMFQTKSKSSLSIFVTADSVEVQNSLNVINDAETCDQNACRSHNRLVDENHTNYTKRSMKRKASHDSKMGISQTKTKRRLEYVTDVSSTPISRNRKRNLSVLSVEESGCKRSRSGRLILPPLDYWRNQRVIRDVDGQNVGLLNGLPVGKFPTGSKSESSRKKKSA